MTKRTAGDLTESSLGSSKFRRRLRGASIRNRVHNNHSAEKKTGSRKRRYAPVEMEHKRTESKHQADGSITLYETRGVRDSTTFSFSNLDDTLSLGNHTGRVDADTFASLFEAANIWLRKAKEKDFFETSDDAEIAKQSVRTNKQRARVGRSTFQRWWFEIGMKHGFLSPSAIAANFLTASDFVHQLVKGNDAAIGAMIAQILLKGGKRLDKAASDAATEDYLDGIEDVPAWSVREAIRKWNRGESVQLDPKKPHDFTWRPEPATLRRLALHELAGVKGRIISLQKLCDAEPLIEYSEEHRKSMLGRIADLFREKPVQLMTEAAE